MYCIVATWKKQKYISIRACTCSIINDELKSETPKLILNNNLMTDTNLSYEAFEDFMLIIKDKNMPMKVGTKWQS